METYQFDLVNLTRQYISPLAYMWILELEEAYKQNDLNNYAYKQWAGMFSDYHLVRWNRFFDELETAIKENKEWDRTPFLDSSCQWEKEWSDQQTRFPVFPRGTGNVRRTRVSAARLAGPGRTGR